MSTPSAAPADPATTAPDFVPVSAELDTPPAPFVSEQLLLDFDLI